MLLIYIRYYNYFNCSWVTFIEIECSGEDNYATRIENTADLNVQRKYFTGFAKLMYNAVNRYGVFDRDTYLFYCSKALNGVGGYWLSNTKEILNPHGEGLA